MASLGLAIVFSGAASAQVEAQNEQMMDLVLQVQQLQDEIRMLRGQLDELREQTPESVHALVHVSGSCRVAAVSREPGAPGRPPAASWPARPWRTSSPS